MEGYFVTEPLNYPLAQLVSIKQNRFDQAVKVLEQKKELLAKAEKVLREVEKERDEVLTHKNAKLEQLRAEMDAGTTTDKIQQMRLYLKTVDEKLAEKERKVESQKRQVELAKKQVEAATAEMYQRKKDLEKLEIHKKEWEKEAEYWVERKEGIEHDEQGSATHSMRKREMKKRKEDDDKR